MNCRIRPAAALSRVADRSGVGRHDEVLSYAHLRSETRCQILSGQGAIWRTQSRTGCAPLSVLRARPLGSHSYKPRGSCDPGNRSRVWQRKMHRIPGALSPCAGTFDLAKHRQDGGRPGPQKHAPYKYEKFQFYVSGQVAVLGQEATWYYQSQDGNH
jgi:hypothetical protein